MESTISIGRTLSGDTSTGWNESILVLSAQNGDLEAFNQLVLRYQDRIYHLALRILGDEDTAEDITQNTFLVAYRSLPRFLNGSFRSWLYRIVTNACYDELRRRKRHPLQPLEFGDGLEEIPLPSYDYPFPMALPEKEMEKRKLERTVKQALDHIEPDQRAVVTLVDLQGLSYPEAAQALGVPLGTVKSRLARARFRLYRLLSDFRTQP